MPSLLNPLTAAIYQTTGLYIDKLREEAEVMDRMSKHFFQYYRDDYQYAMNTVRAR